MVFFKKKRNPHIVQEIVNEDLPNRHSNPSAEQKADAGRLIMDIERLKAQSEANNEMRQFFSDKFSRIDEEIGELRSMLVEREKDIKNLEVTATKASDLVSEVQPEKLMGLATKQDAIIEGIKSKIEAQEQINETLLDELKEIRNTIKIFKGIKEMQKMNKELLEDQNVVKKIEAKIEQHSDEVESMFMEVNKKYEDFRHYKERTEGMQEMFSKLTKEFEDIKVRFSDVVSKDEIYNIEESINKLVNKLTYQVDSMKPLEDEVFKDKERVLKLAVKVDETDAIVKQMLGLLKEGSLKFSTKSEMAELAGQLKDMDSKFSDLIGLIKRETATGKKQISSATKNPKKTKSK